MTSECEQGSTPEGAAKPNWAGFPSTSSEFITLIAHYYRAEIARMAGWRDRIDRTSNWAITVVGAMLSVSLSTPTAHHGVILFAMVLVLLLLVIESRRYRFFDVYRARVRRLERSYYAEVFSPTKELDKNWTLWPRFSGLSFWAAAVINLCSAERGALRISSSASRHGSSLRAGGCRSDLSL
jgi:uncharacterized membrane protein